MDWGDTVQPTASLPQPLESLGASGQPLLPVARALGNRLTSTHRHPPRTAPIWSLGCFVHHGAEPLLELIKCEGWVEKCNLDAAQVIFFNKRKALIKPRNYPSPSCPLCTWAGECLQGSGCGPRSKLSGSGHTCL